MYDEGIEYGIEHRQTQMIEKHMNFLYIELFLTNFLFSLLQSFQLNKIHIY